mmetsp:Transcript_78196/g.203810  ORF Transcript_78196/g.203810 Transcript_78196/m.203810 type:complete len:266 (+) Transcript_78196:289-1086(+)
MKTTTYGHLALVALWAHSGMQCRPQRIAYRDPYLLQITSCHALQITGVHQRRHSHGLAVHGHVNVALGVCAARRRDAHGRAERLLGCGRRLTLPARVRRSGSSLLTEHLDLHVRAAGVSGEADGGNCCHRQPLVREQVRRARGVDRHSGDLHEPIARQSDPRTPARWQLREQVAAVGDHEGRAPRVHHHARGPQDRAQLRQARGRPRAHQAELAWHLRHGQQLRQRRDPCLALPRALAGARRPLRSALGPPGAARRGQALDLHRR